MYISIKNKNFRNLLLGQAISQFGDAGYHFMFIYMVYHITESSTLTGYIGALEALPFLLLSPLAGAVADRINRKKIMLLADLLSAAVLAVLGIITLGVQKPAIPMLFIMATMLSTINTFFSPAKGAAIPRLVEEEQLTEANGLSDAIQSMMPLFSTAVIGGFAAYIMEKSPEYFLSVISGINALTFLGSAFFIRLLPTIIPKRQNSVSILKDTIEGIQYIYKRPVVRTILLAECVLVLCTAPITIALMKLDHVWFHSSVKILTYSQTSFGVGMLFSSLIVSKIKINRLAPFYITATTICALGIASISFCKQAELLIIVNFIIGLTISFANVPVYTYIQHIVADEFQGRVNSVINMLTAGITPFGLGVAGTLLDHCSIEQAFLFMGLGAMSPVMITLMNSDFRKATFKTKPLNEPIPL